MCKVYLVLVGFILFFVFKQKTAYDMRISDWSSDVCSSDLHGGIDPAIESIREIIGLNPVGHLDNLLVGEHQPAEQRRLGRCVDKAITPRHGSPRPRRVVALAFAVRPSARRPPRALAAGDHIAIWAVPLVLRAPAAFIGLAAMLGDRRNDYLPDGDGGESGRGGKSA